jgi:membrane protease YdiL (CAAX protease family)
VIAVLPAILIELALYVAAVLEAPRALLEKLPPVLGALLLTASGVLPLVVYTAPLGLLHLKPLLMLAGLAAVVSFWFLIAGRSQWSMLALLVVMAVVLLAPVLPGFYPRPAPNLKIEFLGPVMWYRVGIVSFLVFGRVPGTGVGFLPDAGEWVTGLKWFVAFVPVAVAANFWIGFAHLKTLSQPPLWMALYTVGTFLGILWVVALREEFFFRGVLQPLLAKWWGEWIGVAGASALFGFTHLWFGKFPNWRFAILAALAGVFYGLAFREGRGVRAAMVTHALVVTGWRMFFA